MDSHREGVSLTLVALSLLGELGQVDIVLDRHYVTRCSGINMSVSGFCKHESKSRKV